MAQGKSGSDYYCTGLLPSIALAPSTTIYDASGRISGTAQTSGNVTTCRDGSGRMTGTLVRWTDSDA
jgi:YD repeat-containing protein